MRIGIRIYPAMQPDTVPDCRWQGLVYSPLHEVTHQDTDERFGIITGQVKMSETIHFNDRRQPADPLISCKPVPTSVLGYAAFP